MPVDTRIEIPFLPQTGITSQILQAIQMANEHHAQGQQQALAQQQLQMQQQAQPSEIGLREAQAGQAQAETAAIPQRLALTDKEITANEELRKATMNAEQQFHMGMLGIQQGKLNETSANNAAKLELEKTKNAWEAHKAAVSEQGTLGNMRLKQEALANMKSFQEKEVTLREQANALHEQGNETAAQAMISRADQIANQTGFWRTALGELGAMPEVATPPAANVPNKPKPQAPSYPAGAVPGMLNGKHGYSLNGAFHPD